MLSDSIRGQLPLLSWYPPPALDEEAKLLAICSEMHATELVEVCRLTWNREQGQEPCSVEQLGDIITTARRTTETNTLKTMYDGRSIEEFYTQIGHLERSSSAFASERRKYIRIHRVRLAQLFRPVTSAPAAPAPPEPLKIAELDNKEDRAKRLAETLNNQRAVVDSEASAAREKMIAGRVLEQQKQVQQVRKI
ncbi:unnamed protein product [Amoebophrya sp. A25]|nr:unnamed protein product [Amoebophrya sp. A25]|eukprot:GSA25T00019214001.1